MGNGLTLTAIGAGAISSATFAAGAITAAALSVDGAAKIGLGTEALRATAALPASTTAAIFTVAGGRCLITSITGEVTTAIQAQACTLKMQANPTATGASVDMCATLDVNGLAVATILGITGTFATALQSGLAIVGQLTPTVVQAGTIDLVTSATNTGSVKWSCKYHPLEAGATIVAA